MTIGELLHWIDRSGSLVVVKDGKPFLRPSVGAEAPDGEVRNALKDHRGYFLSLGLAEADGSLPVLDPPVRCAECGVFVHCGDHATVFTVCGNVACPWWHSGLGPEWFGRARWWFMKGRAEKRAEAKRHEEGIPE